MEVVTKTISQIQTFITVAQAYVQRELDAKIESRLGDCLKELVGDFGQLQVGSLHVKIKEYTKSIEKLKRTYCATDENGVILRDGNDYRYTKENEALMFEEIYRLNDTPVEITPCFCDMLPTDLSFGEQKIFSGFVIKPS